MPHVLLTISRKRWGDTFNPFLFILSKTKRQILLCVDAQDCVGIYGLIDHSNSPGKDFSHPSAAQADRVLAKVQTGRGLFHLFSPQFKSHIIPTFTALTRPYQPGTFILQRSDTPSLLAYHTAAVFLNKIISCL